MFTPTAEQEQRGTGATMPVKIRYTKNGSRYADWSKATPLEELELYRQLAPKEGSVLYSPHPKGPRRNTAEANPAASSASSPAPAAPAAGGLAGPPTGKG
jgi:hypothetical protein